MLIELRVPLRLTLTASRTIEGPDSLSAAEREELVAPDLRGVAEQLVHVLSDLVVGAAEHGILLRGEAVIADLVVPLG